MKPSNFLVISLLLLVPFGVVDKCGPKPVSCDYTSSYDMRKQEFNSSRSFAKDDSELNYENPIPVKVRYDPTPEEKCREEKKINIKQEELCRQELDTVKEAATKFEARKREQPCRPVNKMKKVEGREEGSRMPVMRGNVMCAECEQCELQVKAGGDGVMLRCTGCRVMSPDDVAFSGGNNRRVVRFP